MSDREKNSVSDHWEIGNCALRTAAFDAASVTSSQDAHGEHAVNSQQEKAGV